MSWARKSLILAAILSLSTLFFVQLKSYNNDNNLFKWPMLSLSDGTPIRTILYFHPMFQQRDFYMGALGTKIFKNCTYSNCFATDNKTYLPIEQFDALVFHGYDYSIRKHGKPSRRRPFQRYIFGNLESPKYTSPIYKNLNDFYNWTMTYRHDSDVLRTYGSIEKKKTDYQMPTVEDIQKKQKKIAWFVSHCGTASKRDDLVKKLGEHIPVDIYGKCGTLKCARDDPNACHEMAQENYKFYLSFENSVCEDYVTEKLFKILNFNLVPIVYGGANYTKVAPPNSVINVMDFTNINDLVTYLHFLDTHPSEYLKYFEWKKNYIVHNTIKACACSLCEKLNEPIEKKTYHDIGAWYEGKYGEKCFTTFIDKFLRT